MNIISLGSARMAMSFDDLEININQIYYNNLTFVIRLLTYDELVRINSIQTDDTLINLILEEDVFNLALIEIVGINEEVDLENMEAGIVSSVSGAIINSSNFYFTDIEGGMEKENIESNVFNQMQLIVAKNFNIQFKDILLMSIDELVRKFSLYQKTYPGEALSFDNQEE
ncbi:MAG: hypothetical protein DRQ78_04990 [Epsilonproteobacteria bacterium]|nr:MAG: hypothetical protein DRQ78_04990 [Campylobacterota bacterium]